MSRNESQSVTISVHPSQSPSPSDRAPTEGAGAPRHRSPPPSSSEMPAPPRPVRAARRHARHLGGEQMGAVLSTCMRAARAVRRHARHQAVDEARGTKHRRRTSVAISRNQTQSVTWPLTKHEGPSIEGGREAVATGRRSRRERERRREQTCGAAGGRRGEHLAGSPAGAPPRADLLVASREGTAPRGPPRTCGKMGAVVSTCMPR